MTKSLRKKHVTAWTILAILLPVGIASGWLVIPNPQTTQVQQTVHIKTLPVIYKTVDKKDYLVRIRTNEIKTEWQLEWVNKCVLTVPSAVIYPKEEQQGAIDKRLLVGRIESTGEYLFPLKTGSGTAPWQQYILYDFIHDRVLDTIHLQ